MTETQSTSPDSLADTIANQIEGLTGEQVASVLAAWNTVTSGDPLGTVLRDSVSKAVAHRVSRDGVYMWHVSAPDAGSWFDTQPTLAGWDTLFRPVDASAENA